MTDKTEQFKECIELMQRDVAGEGLTTNNRFDRIVGMKGKIEMDDIKGIEKIDRSQTKAEALDVLVKMNAMLRKMPISEAVKKERFEQLQNKLRSLGWLGLCDESSFSVKADGCWTQLKLVDPDSDEARAIP